MGGGQGSPRRETSGRVREGARRLEGQPGRVVRSQPHPSPLTPDFRGARLLQGHFLIVRDRLAEGAGWAREGVRGPLHWGGVGGMLGPGRSLRGGDYRAGAGSVRGWQMRVDGRVGDIRTKLLSVFKDPIIFHCFAPTHQSNAQRFNQKSLWFNYCRTKYVQKKYRSCERFLPLPLVSASETFDLKWIITRTANFRQPMYSWGH